MPMPDPARINIKLLSKTPFMRQMQEQPLRNRRAADIPKTDKEHAGGSVSIG